MKKEKVYRSPFFYTGDKYKLINELKNYFPKEIDKFIEPFVGGGSVFLNSNAKSFYEKCGLSIQKYGMEKILYQ